MELTSGGLAVECPVYLDSGAIHPLVPHASFPLQRRQIGDSAVAEALPGKHPDFNLSLIEPASVSGRVMDCETFPDLSADFTAEQVGQ